MKSTALISDFRRICYSVQIKLPLTCVVRTGHYYFRIIGQLICELLSVANSDRTSKWLDFLYHYVTRILRHFCFLGVLQFICNILGLLVFLNNYHCLTQ